MSRVLICGGRDFTPDPYVRDAALAFLDDLRRARLIDMVIEGGASGADALGRSWANSWRIPVQTYQADWKTHGRLAGPIRNQTMLDCGRPDLVVAFPGGRGTADMVTKAKRAGVEVIAFHIPREASA